MFIRIAVVVILLCSAAVPLCGQTQTSTGLITNFHGETAPGIITRLELHWGFAGLPPSGLNFKLFRLSATGDTLAVNQIPGGERKFETSADPGMMTVRYRLEAFDNETMLDRMETYALIAHQGGFLKVEAKDTPYDDGGQIDLKWTIADPAKPFDQVKIYRYSTGESGWKLVGAVQSSAANFTNSGLRDKQPYNYMLRGYGPGVILESKPIMNIVCHPSWFNMAKINLAVIAAVVITAIIFFVLRVGKGKIMFIRRIAGLQAVDEAVGRATEMGRSVLFVPGIQDLDDVQTIAGLTILGSVAKLTAQYETKLDVPVSRSLVMSNGREVVREAYLSVGRPDFYNDGIVHYITDEQFGYVAAVDGIMVREKPAACFYLGAFFAESLILAETGNHVGAIQIAGTAMPTQLPFFVAACDYTLIGEELFAASAYLSKDQSAIAALRGQDVGKGLAMGSIIIGVVFTTLASLSSNAFIAKLSDGFLRLFAMNY
ncbi:MAG: hypothetical protein FJY65_10790 [Calditrichaeota bacterium]|nr:hypothetical protein [Calditrichota bacterium]